jgi:hypothetical protein
MTARVATCAWLGLTLLAWVPAATLAQTPVPVVINGDPANRVDVVFLGDGYTASEMGQFAQDVNTAATGLIAQEPFREYQRYLNIRRIEVASTDSGVSHPSRGISKNTAFSAYYGCGGIERLVCVNSSKVISTVQTATTASERDLIIVLVNDTEYGGSGGSVVVASRNAAAVELVLHEQGHTFGLLRDEYGGPPPPACVDTVEPTGANATKETERDKIKWKHWIDASTPLPTTSTTNGVPGLFAGAVYCDTSLYRPVYNSKMRSLNMAWWQINTEQLIKRIYAFVDPIDRVTPDTTKVVTVAGGQSQRFTVASPSTVTKALNVAWWIDGTQVATGAEYVLSTSQVSSGSHKLQVVVSDPTTSVRNDPDGLLTAQASWNVTVMSSPDEFAMTADRSALTLTRGQAGTVGLTVAPASPAFASAVTLACSGLPTSATCAFSPPSIAAGAATATVTMTVTTVAPRVTAPAAVGTIGFPIAGASAMSLAGIVALMMPVMVMASGRRWRLAGVAAALALVFGLGVAACGGGSSGGSPTPPQTTNPGTPTGTYAVVVTGTSGSIVRTVTVTVTVQ